MGAETIDTVSLNNVNKVVANVEITSSGVYDEPFGYVVLKNNSDLINSERKGDLNFVSTNGEDIYNLNKSKTGNYTVLATAANGGRVKIYYIYLEY